LYKYWLVFHSEYKCECEIYYAKKNGTYVKDKGMTYKINKIIEKEEEIGKDYTRYTDKEIKKIYEDFGWDL